MKSIIILLSTMLLVSCSKNDSSDLEKPLTGHYIAKKQIGYRLSAESTFEKPIISDEIIRNFKGLLTIHSNNSYEVEFLESSSDYKNFSGYFFPNNQRFSIVKYVGYNAENHLKLDNRYYFNNDTLVMELKSDFTINGEKGELVLGKLFFEKQ